MLSQQTFSVATDCGITHLHKVTRKISLWNTVNLLKSLLETGKVEVDGYQGTRSVALSYAILESGATGQIVQMDQMLDESINTYQREIDEGLGI